MVPLNRQDNSDQVLKVIGNYTFTISHSLGIADFIDIKLYHGINKLWTVGFDCDTSMIIVNGQSVPFTYQMRMERFLDALDKRLAETVLVDDESEFEKAWREVQEIINTIIRSGDKFIRPA